MDAHFWDIQALFFHLRDTRIGVNLLDIEKKKYRRGNEYSAGQCSDNLGPELADPP